ncbi:MAG: methylated-DNA--[protein]-cysteine S-methyltransferase [Lawsonella clevelandensis]
MEIFSWQLYRGMVQDPAPNRKPSPRRPVGRPAGLGVPVAGNKFATGYGTDFSSWSIWLREQLRFDIPLDWRFSDGFDLQVQRQLRHIPYNTTYLVPKRVPRQSETLSAMRAVGDSCGANPLPILVPCHPVIHANGDLGGYRGGLPTKVAFSTLEKQMRAQGEQAP